MNAQLIYASHDPRAIRWAEEAIAQNDLVNTAWNEFIAVGDAAYPVLDGHRSFAIINGILAGLRRAFDSEELPGWEWAPGIDALVPDNSAEGRPWQKRIDALPARSVEEPLSSVGMVEQTVVTLEDGTATVFTGEVVLAAEGGTVFALWPVHEIKTAMNESLAELHRATGVRWFEMRRSTWYARLEADDAASGAGAL